VLNIKIRRRLQLVQLAYTLIPGAVLLLRASKVFISPNLEWVRTERVLALGIGLHKYIQLAGLYSII